MATRQHPSTHTIVGRRTKVPMSKKGSMDLLYAGLFVFLLIIMTVIGSFVWSQFALGWTTNNAVPQASKDLIINMDSNWYSTFDGGVILMFFLLWIVAIVLSFFLDNSPIFLIAFLIIGTIFIIVLAMLGVFLTELQSSPLAPTLAQLPLTTWIIENWMLMIVFFMVSIGVALYAKNAMKVQG